MDVFHGPPIEEETINEPNPNFEPLIHGLNQRLNRIKSHPGYEKFSRDDKNNLEQIAGHVTNPTIIEEFGHDFILDAIAAAEDSIVSWERQLGIYQE